MIENFIRTKSWRNFLEGLKQKVDIFIKTKNIFNLILYLKSYQCNHHLNQLRNFKPFLDVTSG